MGSMHKMRYSERARAYIPQLILVAIDLAGLMRALIPNVQVGSCKSDFSEHTVKRASTRNDQYQTNLELRELQGHRKALMRGASHPPHFSTPLTLRVISCYVVTLPFSRSSCRQVEDDRQADTRVSIMTKLLNHESHRAEQQNWGQIL